MPRVTYNGSPEDPEDPVDDRPKVYPPATISAPEEERPPTPPKRDVISETVIRAKKQ